MAPMKEPAGKSKRRRFDISEGEQRKESGIEFAATLRATLLQRAREAAYAIASECGEVTADDVFLRLEAQGFDASQLGNAAGSMFRGDVFEFTGHWRKSQRVSNHAHQNRVWRLKRRVQ
jgi:hypothetical protein